MAENEHPLGREWKYMKDIAEGNVPVGTLVNMVGVVNNVILPIQTGGRDMKSTIFIYDESLDWPATAQFSLFRPKEEDHWPHDVQAGDIVVIIRAKCQMYGGPSTISNYSTRLFLYSRNKTPKSPGSAAATPRAIGKNLTVAQLSDKVRQHVSRLHQKISERDDVPDGAPVEERKQLSLNVKDKFSTLENVKDGKFYDLVVQLVKTPFNQGDRMTLWVSDYTQNEHFFPRMADYNDGYAGYMAEADGASQFPVGKMSMQITCFDEHLALVDQSGLQSGQWMHLKNVQVKFGHNGNNLEGFLRGEQGGYSSRYRVVPVSAHDLEGSGCGDKLKDCLHRKRAYEKKEKKRQKGLARLHESEPNASTVGNPPDASNDDGNSTNGKKRAVAEGSASPMNSKKRRELRRQGLSEKHRLEEAKKEQQLNLNQLVRCEHSDQPITPIPTIIAPKFYRTTIEGEEQLIELPFTDQKYHTVARVVGFHPKNVSRFAISHKTSEYDCLSDSDHDSSDSSGSSSQSSDDDGGNRVWEWNFSLRLEDATPSKEADMSKDAKRARMWVEVGNHEGQSLLNMDAMDLSKDPSALASVQEKLTTLWGNLPDVLQAKVDAEALAKTLAKGKGKAKASLGKRTKNKVFNLHKPPADSDDAADSDSDGDEEEEEEQEQEVREVKLKNQPFYCCIREHGVPSSKPDPEKAGMWKVLTMFGVKVVSA